MRALCASALLLLTGAAASADVATFDSIPEGTFATVLTDGGIEFRNLDLRLEGQAFPASFVIENAANILWREIGFTTPNALGFGAYSPGEPVLFGRLGSFDIVPARPAARIAFHVFVWGNFAGRTINLDLSRDGAAVGTVSVANLPSEGLHHYVLDFSGATFDAAHISIGPTTTDYVFALVDTVTIEDAPPCYADWDGSGAVDSADFFGFLTDFFADNADFNADGVTDSRDFFEFLGRFFAGC